MTREEAIKYAQKELETAYERAKKIGHKGKTRYIEVLEMVIKALGQEPILDKIRAEIADLDDADYDYEGYFKAVTDALQIIDKYRGKE